jgi:cytidine deaminase
VAQHSVGRKLEETAARALSRETTLSNPRAVALCNAARRAALCAYAPYSNFRVGAAVLADGEIYVGVNVENAAFGSAICAERVAIGGTVSQGARSIEAVAVACIDAEPDSSLDLLVPCGSCLQVIAELAPDAEILICRDTSTEVFMLSELLPFPFKFQRTRPK